MIVKEYRCYGHGPFESSDDPPMCPHGCSAVVREFRTAPGAIGEKTKTSDRALERLAKRFGLTDMSNKDGSVGGSRKHDDKFKPVWGEMPKGNVYQVGKGEVPVDGSQGGATAALSGLRVADNKGEATFMDLAKNLPKIRPHAVGQFGTPRDLQDAIDKAP